MNRMPKYYEFLNKKKSFWSKYKNNEQNAKILLICIIFMRHPRGCAPRVQHRSQYFGDWANPTHRPNGCRRARGGARDLSDSGTIRNKYSNRNFGAKRIITKTIVAKKNQHTVAPFLASNLVLFLALFI